VLNIVISVNINPKQKTLKYLPDHELHVGPTY